MDAIRDNLITGGGHMEFRLFGAVELRTAGRLLDAGTPRQQTVLAVLAVDAGRPVAIETLIDRVWDNEPPVEARNVLYSHVSRIRRLVGRAAVLNEEPPVRLERERAGYVLAVDPNMVDLHRFSQLVEKARNLQYTVAEQASTLIEALDLWRGQPLAALSGQWVAQVRNRWHQHRLDAVVQWAQAELRLGHPAVVITTLHGFITEYPFVEPLEGLLMRALHAAGRDAEAIDRYITVQQRLGAELGADPGAELRSLHQAILRGELPPPAQESTVAHGMPSASPAQQSPNVGSMARPAQVPAVSAAFVGRANQIRAMTAVIAGELRPGAPRAVAIDGPPGVGKTTLALRLAHDVVEHYPDGQLYVDLRGYSLENQPRSADDVLEEFLAGLGVQTGAIPTGLERRAALYRSILAGRRVLIVLDNAIDSRQVQPLIPGDAGCGILITSRKRLSGMSSEQRVSLGPLNEHESIALLRMVIGAARVQNEPEALKALARLCDQLPLALRIAAERVAVRPYQPIDSLVDELTTQTQRLNLLATEDSLAVKTVFAWSYRELSPDAARMFRLLGLHRGRHISTGAAAALAGEPPAVARHLLDQLCRVHLLEGHYADRYRMHDLLAIYAAELAEEEDPKAERTLAIRRVVDWYLHNSYAANHVLAPRRHDPLLKPSDFAIEIADFDYHQALTWCEVEMENIVMATQLAVDISENVTAWKLPVGYFNYLFLHKRWNSWITSHQTGIVGARRAGDRLGEAWVTNNLATAYRDLGRGKEARTHFERALTIRREINDRTGQAWTLFGIAFLNMEEGKFDEAATCFKEARAVFRETGERLGEAEAIANSGDVYRRMREYAKALIFFRRAHRLFETFNDAHGEGLALAGLGQIYLELNQLDNALNCFQRSLDKRREVGDRWGEGKILYQSSQVHFAAMQPERARECLRAALEIFNELDDPCASDIRELLANDKI
jgi:DNA-binding SARP family transcriptional activator/tetratricopeptide (TPR) repeat protein